MSDLRPPATGTEAYLAAIHEVLCDIRTALVDGPPGNPAATDEQGEQPSREPATPAATKRTRARTRGGEPS